MEKAKRLRRALLGISGALALVLSFTATAGAMEGGRDREPNNMCCKPPTASPPNAAGCPAPRCADSVFCTPFTGLGSWNDGGCTDMKEKNCLAATGDLPKPKYTCLTVTCTKPDGDEGVTCGWVLSGFSDATQQVNSCNGDPCS